MKDQKIILYDGKCRLCTASVKFVSKHDKNSLYRPVAWQSEEGIGYARDWDIDPDDPSSVVLFDGQDHKEGAEAAIKILGSLPRTRFLARIARLFPQKFNEAIYDLIAKHRHIISGHKQA